MDTTPPTSPIPGQVTEKCNLCRSTFICLSQVLLDLPRLLLPSTMRLSILLTGASKVFLYTCSNHLNLFSRIFAKIGATPSLSLNSWFLIRSIKVFPHIHLSIRIFVTYVQKFSLRANILSHTTKQV